MLEEVAPHIEQTAAPKEPSDKAWEAIFANENAANNIFPQAFFAQGLLVAKSFSEQARKEGIDLFTFVKAEPPMDIAMANFNRGRIGAHRKYTIKAQMPHAVDLQQLRQRTLNQSLTTGINFLENVADAVNEIRGGDDTVPGFALSNVQNDPLFTGLLDEAANGLRSAEVTHLSAVYKDTIVSFMHKYPQSAKETTDPKEYEEARELLKEKMSSTIISASHLIQKHMADWVTDTYPDQALLITKLRNPNLTHFLPSAGISLPHPQRDLNLRTDI